MNKNKAIEIAKENCNIILSKQINNVIGTLRNNKRQINLLADGQKILKKEIKTLYKLRLK